MNNKTKVQTNQNRKFVYCELCTNGTIIGLEPNADYLVNVEVMNSAGIGVPSEKYKISTYENRKYTLIL